MKTLVYSLSIALLFLSHTPVQAQAWSELGGHNPLKANGKINCIYADLAGNIYAAGAFINVSSHYYVAKFDGSSWSELGGLNSLAANGEIDAICGDASGNIYAAGNFTDAATNATGNYYVAMYNGTTWSRLTGLPAAAGPQKNINTICTDPSGNVYAAGFFKNDSSKCYVAKYNGTAWSELGGVNALHAGAQIYTIYSDATGNIYAAGAFQDDSVKTYVAKFDGTSWSELGGLNALHGNHIILSVCDDAAGNIYAAGYFRNNANKKYVARFDGTTWSELGGPSSLAVTDAINSICKDAAGNFYAGGVFTNDSSKYYVSRFNGTAWSELGGLNGLAANNAVSSVCSDAAGNVYAAGYFTNDSAKQYVAKFGNCIVPSVPVNTTSTLNINAGSNDTLTATGNATLSWYSDLTGGTFLGSGAGFITPVLTDTTTYYVQDSDCISSARTAITVNVSAATGITVVNAGDNIGVYPNPNSGSFVLETQSFIGREYAIYNIVGKKIMQHTITADKQSVQLNNMAKGTYMLGIKGEKGKLLKFIVE